MVLRWFCSQEEEVVSRFVAIKLPCRPLWRAAKGTVRQGLWSHRVGWLSSAFRRTSTRRCSELLSRSCWNIDGSFVRHGLGLSLVLKAKPRYRSKLEAPWLLQSVDLDSEGSPYILAKARHICWHEDHTDTLSKQFTAAQSPWQCFWQDRFFFLAFDTFSADSSCRLLSYTHTKKRHKWPWLNVYTSKQILVYGGWYPVSPVTDRKKNYLDSR